MTYPPTYHVNWSSPPLTKDDMDRAIAMLKATPRQPVYRLHCGPEVYMELSRMRDPASLPHFGDRFARPISGLGGVPVVVEYGDDWPANHWKLLDVLPPPDLPVLVREGYGPPSREDMPDDRQIGA